MKKITNNQGFTIIELMIATIVFSTILLICTTAVIQISKTYYKGYISARTQEATRSIIEEISRSIQFGGDPVNPIGAGYFCIGNIRYTYDLGKQETNSSPTLTKTNNALISEKVNPPCDNMSTAVAGTTTQYVPNNMRLANLELTHNATNNLDTIKVRLVYGDDDLLCKDPLSCSSNNTMTALIDYQNPNLTCKPKAGNQFCAVSELSTTVVKRL